MTRIIGWVPRRPQAGRETVGMPRTARNRYEERGGGRGWVPVPMAKAWEEKGTKSNNMIRDNM